MPDPPLAQNVLLGANRSWLRHGQNVLPIHGGLGNRRPEMCSSRTFARKWRGTGVNDRTATSAAASRSEPGSRTVSLPWQHRGCW